MKRRLLSYNNNSSPIQVTVCENYFLQTVEYKIPPNHDVHAVSSLLKRYFRQMKHPIIPHAHYQTFIALGGKIP